MATSHHSIERNNFRKQIPASLRSLRQFSAQLRTSSTRRSSIWEVGNGKGDRADYCFNRLALRQIDPTRTKHSRGVRALGLLYAKFRIY